MKKLLMVQLALLALVIVFGTILKGNLSSDVVRMLHKLIGLLVGLVSIASVVVAFKNHQSSLTKTLLLLAVLCTFIAGASGKAAVGGKGSYNASFNKMRTFAVVSLLLSVGSLYSLDTMQIKTRTQHTKDN